MFDTIYVGSNVSSVTKNRLQSPITQVTILAGQNESGDDLVYVAGNTENGINLDVSLPWGTQEIAESILSKVSSFSYQPFSASGATIDPAFELGDGITVGGFYGIICNASMRSSGLVDISAPGGDDIENEIPYNSSETSELSRKIKTVMSTFQVAASEIRAEVQGVSSNLDEAKDDLNGKIDTEKDRVDELIQKTSLSVTPGQVEIAISEAVSGINSITTETGYRFDKDGLFITQTESDTITVIDSTGLLVTDKSGNPVLTAKGQNVKAVNLEAETYLSFAGRARFEEYGTDRVGCFWIGG